MHVLASVKRGASLLPTKNVTLERRLVTLALPELVNSKVTTVEYTAEQWRIADSLASLLPLRHGARDQVGGLDPWWGALVYLTLEL